jgi:DNA-binding transcriptional regulator YhcF (GntR family)
MTPWLLNENDPSDEPVSALPKAESETESVVNPEIERRTIAAQIAQKIEEQIVAGTWTEILPGKRTLAAHYGVNVKTCAVALELLEYRGRISSGHAGRGRTIIHSKNEGPSRAAHSQRLLIMHPSHSILGSEDTRLLHEFEALWKRPGGEVAWAGVNFPRYQRTRPVLQDLIKRHSADALLLYAPTEDWSRQAADLLPFYQIGGPYYADVPISLGSYSIEDEVSNVVRHLRSLGHQRILIPNESLSERIKASVIKGLKEGNDQACLQGSWEDYCPDFTESIPEVWNDYWKKAFSKLKPSAVIIFEDKHLLSLYGFCYTNGIKIPRDLSVICMSYEPIFEWCQPKPTMLRYPLKSAAAHFQQWIKGGLKPIGKKFFPLHMIDGESISHFHGKHHPAKPGGV